MLEACQQLQRPAGIRATVSRPASKPTRVELAADRGGRAGPRGRGVAIPPRPARRRRTLWSLLGILTALVVAVGLATSFTAANTVPLTRAGVSKQPVEVMQLATFYCSTFTLTNLVVAKSSSTTGTSGDDLMLGRNATGTLNGSGGDDCIIAGGHTGTTNTIDGGAGSDICIGAHGATNRFSNCEYSGTP
jgi:hypothetical protein